MSGQAKGYPTAPTAPSSSRGKKDVTIWPGYVPPDVPDSKARFRLRGRDQPSHLDAPSVTGAPESLYSYVERDSAKSTSRVRPAKANRHVRRMPLRVLRRHRFTTAAASSACDSHHSKRWTRPESTRSAVMAQSRQPAAPTSSSNASPAGRRSVRPDTRGRRGASTRPGGLRAPPSKGLAVHLGSVSGRFHQEGDGTHGL